MPLRYKVKFSTYISNDSCLNRNCWKRFFNTTRKEKKINLQYRHNTYLFSIHLFFSASPVLSICMALLYDPNLSVDVNQLAFFCMFSLFAIYLMRSSVIIQNCAHTHTLAQTSTHARKTQKHIVYVECAPIYESLEWSSPSHPVSISFHILLCAAASCFVIVIYLFSFFPCCLYCTHETYPK